MGFHLSGLRFQPTAKKRRTVSSTGLLAILSAIAPNLMRAKGEARSVATATRHAAAHGRRRKAGQTIIFILMVLVILFFVVLWNFDLHKILRLKSVTQNAGDAAAIAASRWQGITLNLVGDLNLMQAVALSEGNAEAASAITNIQARLAFVGPMIGLMAAQQAAKNNGIYVNPAFTAYLEEHAENIRDDYTSRTTEDGDMLFPEPYPGAWDDYADMLDAIAANGVAAGPDNMHLFSDYAGGHMLLVIGFYEAIAGRNWCWFYHNAMELLLTYSSYRDWPDLPVPTHHEYINSEFFGLGLTRRTTAMTNLVPLDTAAELHLERELPGDIAPTAATLTATWYCYATNAWSDWDALDQDRQDAFPIAGEVRPRYDYAGADAAIRIEATIDRLTPGRAGSTVSNTILWTAAAKPLGYLDDDHRPTRYSLVLPAFYDVRLVPVDASSAPSGGGYNLAWREHIETHLPEYVETGNGEPGCWYCEQLIAWEDAAFRQSGIDWLEENSHLCTLPGGGGPSRGGGTRRGH